MSGDQRRMWSVDMDQSGYDVFESAHLSVCANEESKERASNAAIVTKFSGKPVEFGEANCQPWLSLSPVLFQ